MPTEHHTDKGSVPQVSKPLVAIGIMTILLIMSAFLPASWFGVKSTQKRQILDFSTINQDDLTKYDSNGDGDVSWGEVIKETGSEDVVAEAQKAGPPKASTVQALNDPNNLTASYSKNLYLAALQIKEAGGISQEEQEVLLETLAKEEAAKVVSKMYVYGDLKIATQDSRETQRLYGNQVAKILDPVITEKAIYNIVGSMEELAAIKNQNDIKDLELVKKEGEAIGSIIKNLLAVSVPPSASLYHILTLNQLELYKDNLLNLSQAASDPIRAKIASDNFVTVLSNTAKIHTSLSQYFNQKIVTFSPQESGYVFIVGYTPK